MDLPTFAFWTSTDRDRLAIVAADGTGISTGALLDACHRVARNLQAAGVGPNDAVAVCLSNRPEVFAVALATAQIGAYLVPVNRHLTAHEVRYIVQDSGSRVVIAEAGSAALCVGADAVVYSIGGGEGTLDYGELLTGPADPPEHRAAGGVMTYTSGTTGLPKGVRRPLPPAPPEPVASGYAMFLLMYGMTPNDGVHLVTSPLYHTAVLYFATSCLHLGHTLVLMDKWTPEGMLERVQRHRVTNSHMVPTQLVRLLDFDDRKAFDVSSLRHMIHSAAPCPISVKFGILEWWGDVLYEYYAASEGGGTMVTPQEWRKKPGTVGKPWQTAEIRILRDDGELAAPDEVGTVWIKMAQGFEYHGDKDKTEKAWNTDGFFTVGDAGYLDADGYLFLCDRKADMIISGGVNIYPAEIEAALIGHPSVLDVAVFGVPDDDWGEQVKAVIEPKGPVTDGLADEILAWARERIAKYKCPRSIDFVEALPRDPNGKLKKRLLRDPYWEGRERAI
jgi:long-chain acyl-CoA synthetase